MRPEYDGIKFYSASDLSIGYSLSKAVPILEAFTPEREYTDINEILEFYNIQQLINVAYLPEWDDIQKQQYKNTCKKFPAVIGRFFAGIDDSNFIQFCNGVQREHNKKLNNGLPILHKVPPKRDYGRYFCIMAEKGGTSHGGLTEKLSPFFHAKKQEVNAYGR